MDIAVYHENYRLENTYFWFTSRAKIVRKIVSAKTSLRPGDAVLDNGCGTGGFASLLAKKFKVTCLDMEPLAVRYCRKRGLKDVNIGTLEHFDIGERDIKAVFMLDVLEHIDDDAKVVKQVWDILPEKGSFIVTVPAYQWMWSRHDEIHRHYRRHTRKSLRKLLNEGGFELKYISYFNTFLFPFATANFALSKLRRRKKEAPIVELPGWVNKGFEKIFSAEKYFLPALRFPYGLSLVAVAVKRKTNKNNGLL